MYERRPCRAAVVGRQVALCGDIMFTKMFGSPPLANDYSYADRIMNDYDHASCRERHEGIVGHVPREMSRTFWHFIMYGGSVGCKITGRRTLGKGGGGGRINEGGRIHDTNSFDVEK